MKSSSKVSPHPPLQDRCRHRSPAGRRCSQPACSSHATLCFTQAPKSPSREALIAAELSESAGFLATPSEVNRLLSKTLLAFIAGRLPHKKAGMIGFLGQIIPALTAKSPSTNGPSANSTLAPSSTTSLARIAAKSSPILPNLFSLPAVKKNPRPPTPRQSRRLQQPRNHRDSTNPTDQRATAHTSTCARCARRNPRPQPFLPK